MIELPICRWRGQHENGNATCTSQKVHSPANGFNAAHVCINRNGTPCIFADHAPLTEAELQKRQADKAAAVSRKQYGPGAHLINLLDELGIMKPNDCKCASRAAQMNRWGVEGCREHRLEIAEWLREAAIEAVKEFPVTDSVESFLPLVDEAIRRAESHVSKP